MASANFGKDSTEWKMFGEYWKLCQLIWYPEDDDKYWDYVIELTGEFSRKFSEIPLSSLWVIDLVQYLEEKLKERNGKPRDARLRFLLKEINHELND